ncbi:MAG: PHP domain-containing protein [Candidatus Methanomethylophilaceae archaeon]|jgi:predicted metal-dependent phosphoesterase TrpH|nr:PHP domain-containing protein [Candidatus Methanomethylophilaceae archaeon]
MRADLHVHSSFSSDGHSRPGQIIEAALARGLGCVAVTDHNSFEAYDLMKDDGRLIIIPGEEVSSKEGHILAYGIDREIPRGMSVRDTIDDIRDAGGVAFAAHPYRWWSGLGERNVLMHDFDGVEALNARSVPWANRDSFELALQIGKPVSAGSDSHSPRSIGKGYVELPEGLRTWQDVISSVMRGEAEPHSSDRTLYWTVRYGVKSIGQWMFRGFRRM